MLPQNVFGIQFIKSSAKFVLVIEKDATFQKLLNDEAPRKLGPCILITVNNSNLSINAFINFSS